MTAATPANDAVTMLVTSSNEGDMAEGRKGAAVATMAFASLPVVFFFFLAFCCRTVLSNAHVAITYTLECCV